MPRPAADIRRNLGLCGDVLHLVGQESWRAVATPDLMQVFPALPALPVFLDVPCGTPDAANVAGGNPCPSARAPRRHSGTQGSATGPRGPHGLKRTQCPGVAGLQLADIDFLRRAIRVPDRSRAETSSAFTAGGTSTPPVSSPMGATSLPCSRHPSVMRLERMAGLPLGR